MRNSKGVPKLPDVLNYRNGTTFHLQLQFDAKRIHFLTLEQLFTQASVTLGLETCQFPKKVAEEPGISFGSTQSIMNEILGVNRLNAVLVPKDLTFDQKNARKETASLNLEATTDDPELLKNYPKFIGVALQKLAETKGSEESSQQSQGHVDGRNGRSCGGASRGSSTTITRRRTQPSKSRSSCRTTQPLCTPNPPTVPIWPSETSSFWKAQKKLKGRKYQSIEEIKVESKKAMKAIQKTDYQSCFADWKKGG
ncbi:hypothetical protein LAZ67_20000672 [Cordylochernes scorpioides]|uniref:Uncharacterized protein n=1 Tax=Cordylochernes scorpioides TaxID=51811 RepID=A0ABY6LNJ7_9ARAC|nr:hypothetical protein LAZ67_20000672 [Cordylochernes scorpioides]